VTPETRASSVNDCSSTVFQLQQPVFHLSSLSAYTKTLESYR